MMDETWVDQHARLLRSHRRVQKALGRRAEPDDPDYDALDALYHFCCDALNLRDWISNELSQHGPEVVELIRNSIALSACADIANGSKHFTLTGTPYTPGGHAVVVQKGTVIYPAPARIYPNPDGPTPQAMDVGTKRTTFTIDAGENGVYDALDIAAEAVNEWATWLGTHGLL